MQPHIFEKALHAWPQWGGLIREARTKMNFKPTLLEIEYEARESLLEEYLPGFYWRMIIANPEASEGKYKPFGLIGIQTDPSEKPLNSLESAIRKGIKQLPRDKPGILAIHYTDPIEDFNSLCPGNVTMQEYISGLLTPFQHIGAVLMSSEPDYLGLKESKAGKTYLFYRKPWAFREDFLHDDT